MAATDRPAGPKQRADAPRASVRLRAITIAVHVMAAVAVATVAVLFHSLWPPPRYRPFEAYWPTVWHFFPTLPMLAAYAAALFSVYHCVMFRIAPAHGLRTGRLGCIGAGHAVALLILSLHAVLVILEATESLFMLNGRLYLCDDLYYIVVSSMPVVVLVLASVAALGRYLAAYVRVSAIMLEVALIGIAAAVLAVELTAHMYMPGSL